MRIAKNAHIDEPDSMSITSTHTHVTVNIISKTGSIIVWQNHGHIRAGFCAMRYMFGTSLLFVMHATYHRRTSANIITEMILGYPDRKPPGKRRERKELLA